MTTLVTLNYYSYKDATYQILDLPDDVYVRDDKGEWQKAVKYFNPKIPGKMFFRAANDFMEKYKLVPMSVATA